MPVEPLEDQHMVRLTTTQTARAKAIADDAGLRFAAWLRSLVLSEIARADAINHRAASQVEPVQKPVQKSG